MTTTDRWGDEQLDAWRRVGDADADEVVAAYFESIDEAPVRRLARLARHAALPPEDQVPAIRDFLAARAVLPPWADTAAMARGQDFFSDWALHEFTALYLASLPMAYAAARGAHVIWLTGRLRDDAERRLNETAQFLMDTSAPGAFADGRAFDRILHVRLMHAGVRWLIDNDPAVGHPPDASPEPLPDGPVWSPAWGVPLNQEDLAGTMLTFTTVVFDAFQRSGVEFGEREAADSLELWRVIASTLGVVDDLIPADLTAARELQRRIFGRQHERSAVGIDLTRVLLDLVGNRLPWFVSWLAAPMLRRYVGDHVADLLEVGRSRAADPVLRVLVELTRLGSFGHHHDPVPRWISRRVGRALIEGLLEASRKGEPVPFAIPTELSQPGRAGSGLARVTGRSAGGPP